MKDSLHAVHDAYENIDRLGDQWARLNELVDFEMFREPLEACWRKASKPAQGGRPPWDAVLMFKILLVGLKTGCSDEKLEFLLTDSLSLKRFLHLPMDAPAPDRTTIARYRSELDASGVRDVFELFHDQLEAKGYEAKDGQMLDATFVLVPIQRNTREENQTIKEMRSPRRGRKTRRPPSCGRRTRTPGGRKSMVKVTSATRTTSVWMSSTSWCAAR